MYSNYVCKELLEESTITDQLKSYFGSYTIFNSNPAPEDAEEPLITIIDGNSEVEDSRLSNGGLINIEIRIWTNKDHDLSDLQLLSNTVRSFLHRKIDYTLDSGEVIDSICSFPQYVDLDGFPGSLMNLELHVADVN